MISEKYNFFLIQFGESLADIGINEIALNREYALKAVDILRTESIPILGGDVYEKQDETYCSTYDNWYCEKSNYTNDEEYLKESWNKAENYIKNYNCGEGNLFFFTIVIPVQ